MILTSGKVLGNVGAQWKELSDKRGHNKGNESVKHKQTGKEIVPVDKFTGQEVQTANKFAILEVEDCEINENNQLALVEDNSIQRSHSPKETGRLNLAANVFKPKSPTVEASKIGNNPNGKGTVVTDGIQKESTTQWVSRTFVGNQSYEEVLSQSIDINIKNDPIKDKDQIQPGKL